METLILIGLLGGLITGISPCILPMLPVIFFAGGVQGARNPGTPAGSSDDAPADRPSSDDAAAAGSSATTAAPSPSLFAGAPGTVSIGARGAVVTATAPAASSRPAGDRADRRPTADDPDRRPAPDGPGRRSWRPYLVILGLVLSFSVFTLLGSLLLTALGLPQDLLRWLGIVLLAAIGVGMIVPRFEEVLERPFQKIAAIGSRRAGRRSNPDKGAFLLGLGLGVLYVPCAGPVLAAITVAGATGNIGPGTVALTLSFAIGAAIPLLVFALAGRRVAERVKSFRTHQRGIRITGGVVMIALAAALALDLPAALQRALPDYTGALQEQVDDNAAVREALDLGGIVTDENRELSKCSNGGEELESCGTAPELTGITQWLNTPDESPIALADLRGKVVLLDFWTYSCINCQRAIPNVAAWYDTYEDYGLEVIGVHTPEFAFERETRNVIEGAKDLGVDYPIAQDNAYSTWTTYRNRYWPAEYLIDADGTVRHIKFGEGGYATTEKHIRELLTAANPGVELPPATNVADATPVDETTPETYFGISKSFNYDGEPAYDGGPVEYTANPDQPQDTYSLDGGFDVDHQGATATEDGATVRLAYDATNVFAVLGGEGTARATVTPDGGEPVTREIEVSGNPTLYDVLRGEGATTGTVELELPAGATVYTFTFG
ncbi:cytochrome c biogenesis protein CcdA [Sediminihabitans luteus]|uniref:Cytochrome c biogenesis protein CcdA n=1 Tax=Sediminihabitans luteus TaxID=1138585 RepID=A0A2M9CEK7_9CELL|nr:cytochrome c biogenesis protein DipZ [Sediminihabitans luteus]PJJ70319.1 cytochrome c biogenesis protein CcdA [Sediminihabitans luteus]GII97790.1 protein DipZ [Sediminihabitans luteus]